MSLEYEFRDLMPQSVIVKTRTGRGTDGAPTFSTAASTYRARVVNVNTEMRDQAGVVKVARYEVWVHSTGILAVDSRYQLPDGATPPVLSIDIFPDDGGNHHSRVRFGW